MANEYFLLIGTENDEDIIGTGRWERIWGLGGRDRIYAKAGNDELYGGAGDDTLDGGVGQDLMFGGSGNDKYVVDNVGDVVSEETTPGVDDGGTDTVVSSITFALGNFVEKLELQGTSAIDGAGNALNNNIKGNAAANVLFGGAGTDTLSGFGGDDVLIGGLGRDYYTGGDGADTFVLKNEPGEWDRVYDFNADDTLGIYASEFGLVEGAGLTGGVLSASYFVVGTAATASGRGQFIWKSSTSELLWDPDGTGATKAYRIALIDAFSPISAGRIVAQAETATASVASLGIAPSAEGDSPAYFQLTLSQPLNQDVILTYSTVNGTAVGGQDFVALNAVEVLIKAGSTTAYVPVTILDDPFAEGVETFSLRLDAARFAATGAPLAIGVAQASGSITDDSPVVVADHYTASLGMTDPSALAYDPVTDTLFMADSEVDEAPFSRAKNFFAVGLDGSLKSGVELLYTDEPTGLAIDAANRRLFVTDDDAYEVYCVNADSPTTVLWSFDTRALGGIDPEDIAFDTQTGRLFIVNGLDRKIIEVNAQGTQLFSSVVLPSEIVDPEALAYDTAEDIFYVGGGFSDLIWKVDRAGQIVDVITTLQGARDPVTNHRVSVKDIELAPASDGSGEMHIYVADYGWSHVDDGRLIEIDPGDGALIA